MPAAQPYAVPEASGPTVASIDDPKELPSQTRPGFYGYDVPWHGRSRIVAYVVPPGRISEAPATVRALPIVAAMSPRLFSTGAVVIFEPEVASYRPVGADAARRPSRKPRPIARAAAYDDCPGGRFCMWDFSQYGGDMFTASWTDGVWRDMSPYGWANRASSYRVYRGTDALLSIYNAGQHPRECYDSYTASSTMSGTMNNNASSVFVSESDGRC